jgi:hypothetical protein
LINKLKALKVSDADLALFSANSVNEADYDRYCNVAILMFTEIASMPQRDAALILRSMYQ